MEAIESSAETIRRWISTSTTDQHLAACRDMIYLLAERYAGHHSMPEIKELLLKKITAKREELELSNPLK
jgi:hypothetical protein